MAHCSRFSRERRFEDSAQGKQTHVVKKKIVRRVLLLLSHMAEDFDSTISLNIDSYHKRDERTQFKSKKIVGNRVRANCHSFSRP